MNIFLAVSAKQLFLLRITPQPLSSDEVPFKFQSLGMARTIYVDTHLSRTRAVRPVLQLSQYHVVYMEACVPR